ncbi:MAG: FHA domain-containing protein [Thermoguttaceae bacterium]|nr:FHA domain-containing protein [Thermoguttaceae bacterium]MDW8037210.1 FHA domain-containing protein [Thermoguttaceae bacterium]
MSYGSEPIRITREEALSPHVDDLLRRQMSLRGESGVTRTRRKWYYQNWFVFMVVGCISALVAWAIIEPLFDDMLYIQGPLGQIESTGGERPRINHGLHYIELQIPTTGWIQVQGHPKIWTFAFTKQLLPDGSIAPLDLKQLKEGQTVGVYVEYEEFFHEPIVLGRYIVLDPPPPSGKATLTLSQLKSRQTLGGLLLFPVVAGLIGLSIGAVDGLICRLPLRALLSGVVGLLVGFLVGFVAQILAGLVYLPFQKIVMEDIHIAAGEFRLSPLGFLVQMCGRGLAWCVAGAGMGLGQGIALRSKRLFLYGLLGGIVGGLLGGLFFDPIDILLLGIEKPSAHWSRLVGLAVIGASVGAMIGVVELLARDAWLRMVRGPLAGKEFLLFKDVMHIGSSPRSDLYLFNDPGVAPQHGILRAVGDEYEIQSASEGGPIMVNNRPIRQSRLRHGDLITISQTEFVFQKRKG